VVDPFRPLQEVDSGLGERCCQSLVCRLDQPLRDDDRGQHRIWDGTSDGQGDEYCRVKSLSNNRGADRARPQPASGGDLHLGEHKRVSELANQIPQERCNEEAGRVTEDRLKMPPGRPRRAPPAAPLPPRSRRPRSELQRKPSQIPCCRPRWRRTLRKLYLGSRGWLRAARMASRPSVSAAGPGCRISGDLISKIRFAVTAGI
jgi:hypothetical protein